MSEASVVAWVATYLLHSTLLIAAVWLLTRLLGMKAMAVQDRLWKVALLGALFTCTVQAGLGDRMPAPRITIPSMSSADMSSVDEVVPPVAVFGDHRRNDEPAQALQHVVGQSTAHSISRTIPLSWLRSALLLWCLGGILFTGSLVYQVLKLGARFRDRREIRSGPAHRIFRLLVASRRRGCPPVRLTASDRITVPVAYGIQRPEICLPGPLLHGASPEVLKSVLAHELAHIVRRDQVWLLTARLVESIFFFQPLVRLARRCYQETAEFICDQEAVRQTGQRVPLARSLHEMACRQVSAPTALTIPGISGKGPPLNRRIEMILDKNRPPSAHGRARWFGPLAAALILVFALLAPGVTAFDDPPSAPVAPEAARAPAPEEVPEVDEAPDMVPEPVEPPEEPDPPEPPEPLEPDAEELAAMEAEMAEEAEAMRRMELEMAAEEEAMARAELEMEREQEHMRQLELEMLEQEEAMARAELEMESEAAEMAAAEREMELMSQELATHELELARAERELAAQEEALARELEALEEEAEEEEGAGAAGGASREEARAREREIRRRHEELRQRHREISRHNRDVARQQVEELRQRRAVFHSRETALAAQRRGLERALRGIERSLEDELTGEQRERLEATRKDIEAKLELLEERNAVERTIVTERTVPRPEEIE